MNILLFGCLIDKFKFIESIDVVDHSIICLQDKEMNSTDVVKLFNEKNEKLKIKVYEIEYSNEMSMFYILGFEFKELDKKKSLETLMKEIEDECFRFSKQRPACKLYSLDEEYEYQIY